jgi:epoxyqueuosine reductase
MPDRSLTEYLKRKALAAGALLVGTTHIRRVEPVMVFAFPFTQRWFLQHPFTVSAMLGQSALQSRHVLNLCSRILLREGYTAQQKTIWSVYGDFRPLAVAAGLGEWGRHGIVVNRKYGAGLLFAAVFTNAPLSVSQAPAIKARKHCQNCGQCLEACPYGALDRKGFHPGRCLRGLMAGCAECLRACGGR